MMAGLLALSAGLLIAAADPSPSAGGTEIDRVVAVVRTGSSEARVLTRSRVEEETRIALVSHGGVLAATEALDDATLAAGLQAIIDETLLVDDAARLQILDTEGDRAGAELLAGFRGSFAAPAEYQEFLRRWDLSEQDVETVLRRKARVQRYLDSRVSHAAQVSEGEITAWLDEHATSIGARDRELARVRLTAQRVAIEVKAFLRELRARAEIRILPRPN